MGAACAKAPWVGARSGGRGRNEELQEGWGGCGGQSRLGRGWEVSRDPESHPSESLMGLKEGAPT